MGLLPGDGLIQSSELQHVMRACMEENGMQFSEEQVADLTMALFEDADHGGRGAITYEALKNQLEKHGGLLENLSIRYAPYGRTGRLLFQLLFQIGGHETRV